MRRRMDVQEALALFWSMEERGDPIEPLSSSDEEDSISSSDERYKINAIH